MLKIIGIPRSTYYYQKNYRVEEKKVSEGRPAPGYSFREDGKKVSDEQIKEYLLEEIVGDGFNYGYRKLTKVIRRKYKLIINKKKVYRLCKELGILRPQRQKKAKHPRKLGQETVSLQNPISFGKQILNTVILKEKTAFSLSCHLSMYTTEI